MTLATMGQLARFRGHFYNWYDTRDLRPLDPPYVSTVDSGNLAGHLITLANACREWTVLALSPAQRLAGIADALDLAREAMDPLRDGRRTLTVTWQQLDETLAALSASVHQARLDNESIAEHLADLAAQAETMADIASAFARRTRRRHWRGHAVLGGGGTSLDRQPSARHRSVTGDGRRSGGAPCDPRSDTRGRWRSTWVTAFCSIPTASCCRSAIGWPTAPSTRVATTFSPPRRGSRASSRSPRATSRPAIGSISVARSRRSRMAPR